MPFFDRFLDLDSGRALHAVMPRIGPGVAEDGCEVRFVARDGTSRSAGAAVGPDPSGQSLLVACVEIREPRSLRRDRPP